MSNKNNIDEIIKKSFEKRENKAPKDLWNTISESFDNKTSIDKKVKKSFSEPQSKAPEKIWQAVNKQLNIDNAWKGVERMLKWRTFWRKTRRIAAIILLLLSFGIGTYKLMPKSDKQEVSNNSKLLSTNNTTKAKTRKLSSTEPKTSNSLDLLSDSSFRNLPKKQASVAHKTLLPAHYPDFRNTHSGSALQRSKTNIRGIQKKNHWKAPQPSNKLIKLAYAPIKMIESDTSVFNRLIITSNKLEVDSSLEESVNSSRIQKQLDNSTFKRFELGIIYAFNQTWLFNNETYRSFDSNSLISSEASIEGSYGITGTYFFTPKSGLNLFGYMQSKTKQIYRTYEEGKYIRKDISLEYGKIGITYQNNFLRRKSFLNTQFNVRLGVYYAWLKQGVASRDESKQNVTSNYTNDIGTVAQVGHEINHGPYAIGYGFNFEYGLTNVFKGDGKTPSHFNKTNTLNAGGYLTARYKF